LVRNSARSLGRKSRLASWDKYRKARAYQSVDIRIIADAAAL
jgi:hypothetical protein